MPGLPVLVVISTIVFQSQFACVQHMDEVLTNKPENSNVTYLNMHTAIIELYGAHGVAVCRGATYKFYLMEEDDGKTYN